MLGSVEAKIMLPPPNNAHILIPRNHDYITSHEKRSFMDVTK